MRGEIQSIKVFRHTEAKLMEILSGPAPTTDPTSITMKKVRVVLTTPMQIYKNAYKPPKPKKTRGWVS